MIRRTVLDRAEHAAAEHLFKLKPEWSPTGFCPLCDSLSLDKIVLPAISLPVTYIGLQYCRNCGKFFKRTTRVLTMKGWGRKEVILKVRTCQPGEDDMRML